MKTHLLTKKRALISSVAMLLVAIIALGTATFAWFTKSTTATANGINVSTIKASDLQISKLDKSWGTTINYEVGYNKEGNKIDPRVLMPASTANGTDWFKASAEKRTEFTAKGNAELVSAAEKINYYFAEQLNVRNNGEADVNNVRITFNISDESQREGYYRIALVPVDDTETNAGAAAKLPSAAKNFFVTKTDEADTLQNIYGEADNGYQAVKGAKITDSANLTAKVKPNTDKTVRLGTLAGKTTDGKPVAKYYNLYVWFEGQDEDCTDEKAGAQIPNITFSVTGDTDTQQTGN